MLEIDYYARGGIRTLKILILTFILLPSFSFMGTKLVVLGKFLFIGFVIIIIIVFISVSAVVISTVCIIWAILVIKIRLTVSLLFVVSTEGCLFLLFLSEFSFHLFKSFINPMFRAVRNRMPMITAIVAKARVIWSSFYIGVFKGARVNSANFVFLIRLVSSLICASRLLILSFVCFTVPSMLTVNVKSFVIK